MKKLNLLFITNLPSPYRLDFFREMSLYFNIKVVCELDNSPERNSSWSVYNTDGFQLVILKSFKIIRETILPIDLFKSIDGEFDHIFILNPLTPTGILSNLYFKKNKISFFIEIDGGLIRSKNLVKVMLKKLIFNNADKILSPSLKSDEYILNYVNDSDKIFRYRFSSVKKSSLLRSKSKPDKIILRDCFHVKEEFIVLSVGRFISDKNYYWFLKNWNRMDPKIAYVIVGEGRDYDLYQNTIKLNSLDNVYLVPFQTKLLNRIYQESDIFLHPSCYDPWGLVVNEAMANALPIISTTNTLSAVELIENGINGYLFECREQNDALNHIRRLYNQPSLLLKLSENSLIKARENTIEDMVDDHMKFIASIMKT